MDEEQDNRNRIGMTSVGSRYALPLDKSNYGVDASSPEGHMHLHSSWLREAGRCGRTAEALEDKAEALRWGLLVRDTGLVGGRWCELVHRKRTECYGIGCEEGRNGEVR